MRRVVALRFVGPLRRDDGKAPRSDDDADRSDPKPDLAVGLLEDLVWNRSHDASDQEAGEQAVEMRCGIGMLVTDAKIEE